MARGLGRWPLVWLALLAAPALASTPAPEPHFERLGTESGLSHNSVLSIIQDRQGFLWLGTADGLNRYDGRGFTVWRADTKDPDSLSRGSIHSLLEDSAGRLWVGTSHGVNRFDRQEGRFKRYALAGDPRTPELGRVRALYEDRAGVVWAGLSEGLFRYEPESDSFEAFLHDGNDPHSLAAGVVADIQQDPSGAIWALTSAGTPEAIVTLNRLDADSGRFLRYRLHGAPQLTGFLIDDAGRFWVNVTGLGRLDPVTGELQKPILDSSYAPMGRIYQDREGLLWLSAREGVVRCDPDTGQVWRYAPSRDSLSAWVIAFLEDRAGTLWLGTRGGLYKWDRQRKPFDASSGSGGDSEAVEAQPISSMLEDSSGALWVGTYGAGLIRSEKRGAAPERFRHQPGDPTSLCHDMIWHMTEGRRGRIWLGTEDGLCSYDPLSRRFRRHRVDRPARAGQETRITYLALDRRGRLWLASHSGLVSFDPETEASTRHPARRDGSGPSTNVTHSLLITGGALWLGTQWEGLDRLDLETGVFSHYPLSMEGSGVLRSEGVFDIHRDRAGVLWLATSDGLSRFDPEREHFTHYFVTDGLPGSVVYSILEDDDDRLWLGTSGGLARFDPHQPPGRQLRSFDLADGVGNVEFNRHAAWRGSDGRFYFGGMDGLTSFHPDRIRDNPFPPSMVLTRIQVWRPAGVSQLNPHGLDRLRLSYRESSFSFEFAALSFTSPEKNRYAYKLDGLDEDWVDAGHQASARYTQVPPGDYVFRVKGTNNDGLWSREQATLAIIVTPPYWQTWWFRTLLVLAVIGLALAWHRARLARLLEVERLRVRIASDLHDDVSSDLSGVALATALVQRQAYLREGDRDRLADAERTARGILESLRDIVWYINPEHDKVEAVLRRMKATASSLLGDIAYRFEADLPQADGVVDMALRRNVFLIFKEALHNVARHSRAENVRIRLEQRAGTLVLEVTDDGIGFDLDRVERGDGLASMRRRAREIGAALTFESRPGGGSTTRLELNLEGRARGRKP